MGFDIDLTPEEEALFAGIEWPHGVSGLSQEAHRKNGAAVEAIMKSLIARNAIPEVRKSYVTDGDYRPSGRGISLSDEFQRNGTPADAIFRHGNFLKYFRYIVRGADLPNHAREGFRREVEACGNITSGDIIPLAKWARNSARAMGGDPKVRAEEFFKLALDCGLDPDDARTVRQQVRTIR